MEPDDKERERKRRRKTAESKVKRKTRQSYGLAARLESCFAAAFGLNLGYIWAEMKCPSFELQMHELRSGWPQTSRSAPRAWPVLCGLVYALDLLLLRARDVAPLVLEPETWGPMF